MIEGHVARAELGQRVVHRTAGHQAPLAEPDVEVHVEEVEHLTLVAQRPFVAPLEGIRIVGHLRGPVDDVLALVAVFGWFLAGLPRNEGRCVVLHLEAAIVQVALAGHVVATALEHPGQRVAEGGSPTVSGMKRTVRVGRDELDVDPLAATEVGAGVAGLALGDHVGEHVVEPGLAEVEVHEARTGDLDPCDVGRAGWR